MPKTLSQEFVSSTADLKKVEGNLLTMVETLGFPEERMEAIKSQVRRFLWQLKMRPLDKVK